MDGLLALDVRYVHVEGSQGAPPPGEEIRVLPGVVDLLAQGIEHLVLVRHLEPSGDLQDLDFLLDLNQYSMEILTQAWLEPNLKKADAGTAYQFERLGYFCLDSRDSKTDSLVFNRIVTLRDSWGGN